MNNKRYQIFLLSIISLICINNSNLLAQEQPTPSDLISYEDPRQVVLSPDGKKVILQTRKANFSEDSYDISVWLIDTKSQEKKELSLPESVQSIEWLPNGNQIAYLAQAKRQLQVWIKHIQSDSTQQITKAPAA